MPRGYFDYNLWQSKIDTPGAASEQITFSSQVQNLADDRLGPIISLILTDSRQTY